MAEPVFTTSSTTQVWRLTFDASFDRKLFGEMVIYKLDQSGPFPFPHQIDFIDEDEAAKAYDIASYGQEVEGTIANIRVTTWRQRIEATEPADVDLATFGRQSRRERGDD